MHNIDGCRVEDLLLQCGSNKLLARGIALMSLLMPVRSQDLMTKLTRVSLSLRRDSWCHTMFMLKDAEVRPCVLNARPLYIHVYEDTDGGDDRAAAGNVMA